MKIQRPYQILGIVLVALSLVYVGCSDDEADEAAAGDEQATPEVSADAIPVETAFYFTHVNGHEEDTEMIAYVLFEFELLEIVKYQVAYVACTCRAPKDNFWSVAYVELNKSDGSVKTISWNKDTSDHYTAGMYGDTVVTWENARPEEMLYQFADDFLIGKSQEEINAIEAMHGEVDAYTGATVTPNNAARMLQGLFRYHNKRYM